MNYYSIEEIASMSGYSQKTIRRHIAADKLKADKIKPKFLQIAVKSLFAMLSTLLCYTILLVIFPNPLLTGEINDAGIGIIIAFFIIFTITFLMYDFAAGKMLLVYRYRFRKKFFKG